MHYSKEVWGVYNKAKENFEVDRERGRRAIRQERSMGRKGQIHIHIQLAPCVDEIQGWCVDKEVLCRTKLVDEMGAEFNGLNGPLPSFDVYTDKGKAVATSGRGLTDAAQL